ncbi:hypothetical protein AAMO2058_000977200 [Amorphochlora amoebiformis]
MSFRSMIRAPLIRSMVVWLGISAAVVTVGGADPLVHSLVGRSPARLHARRVSPQLPRRPANRRGSLISTKAAWHGFLPPIKPILSTFVDSPFNPLTWKKPVTSDGLARRVTPAEVSIEAQPEMLVDLGGASFTVHFFDGGDQKATIKSKSMLTNSSCPECIALKEEGLKRGWIKERTPPDYAELGYTFADYSDKTKHSWEEVSCYLSRIIRVACRQISENYPEAVSARLTVLQTGKIRAIGGKGWEKLMRVKLQEAFGSATFLDVDSPPQHALLSVNDEAYFEGLMMFKYQDLSHLKIKPPQSGEFLHQYNALALSIGSSSTQMYTLDSKDGSLIFKTNAKLGVYPPDFPINSLKFKTGSEIAGSFKQLLGGVPPGKKFLLLVNAIGYVMKEIPTLSDYIDRQEPIPTRLFCEQSRKWLQVRKNLFHVAMNTPYSLFSYQSMRSYKHRRWDLDLELYHQLQLLNGLVEALESHGDIKYIIVEKKGHLKPNGLHMIDERKLDYHWVTAVHKHGLGCLGESKGISRSGTNIEYLNPRVVIHHVALD